MKKLDIYTSSFEPIVRRRDVNHENDKLTRFKSRSSFREKASEISNSYDK